MNTGNASTTDQVSVAALDHEALMANPLYASLVTEVTLLRAAGTPPPSAVAQGYTSYAAWTTHLVGRVEALSATVRDLEVRISTMVPADLENAELLAALALAGAPTLVALSEMRGGEATVAALIDRQVREVQQAQLDLADATSQLTSARQALAAVAPDDLRPYPSGHASWYSAYGAANQARNTAESLLSQMGSIPADDFNRPFPDGYASWYGAYQAAAAELAGASIITFPLRDLTLEAVTREEKAARPAFSAAGPMRFGRFDAHDVGQHSVSFIGDNNSTASVAAQFRTLSGYTSPVTITLNARPHTVAGYHVYRFNWQAYPSTASVTLSLDRTRRIGYLMRLDWQLPGSVSLLNVLQGMNMFNYARDMSSRRKDSSVSTVFSSLHHRRVCSLAPFSNPLGVKVAKIAVEALSKDCLVVWLDTPDDASTSGHCLGSVVDIIVPKSLNPSSNPIQLTVRGGEWVRDALQIPVGPPMESTKSFDSFSQMYRTAPTATINVKERVS